MNKKQKLKDLKEMEECARVSELIERADSEHCKALEIENVADQEIEK